MNNFLHTPDHSNPSMCKKIHYIFCLNNNVPFHLKHSSRMEGPPWPILVIIWHLKMSTISTHWTYAWSTVQGPLWYCVYIGPQSRTLCGTVCTLVHSPGPSVVLCVHWSAVQGLLWYCVYIGPQSSALCGAMCTLVRSPGPSVVLCVHWSTVQGHLWCYVYIGPQSRALCGTVCTLVRSPGPSVVLCVHWSTVQGHLWYCVCIINSYCTLLN